MDELNLEYNEMREYFRMNFQSLSLPHDDLNSLSQNAISKKTYQMNSFQKRLRKYVNDIVIDDKGSLNPILSGLDGKYLTSLASTHNGLLCGLFHFGAHRHFLLDTVSMGIKTVVPIAGDAYQDLQTLARNSNEEIARRIQLLKVEGEDVGLKTLKALRSGFIGGIYIDGNMGPSNKISSEGCVNVNFFNHSISVKAGIARLSLLLKLPILPIFCDGHKENPSVYFGELISPLNNEIQNKEAYYQKVMQSLYLALEKAVKNSPEDWEYALCLHRWINSVDIPTYKEIPLLNINTITLNTDKISILEKEEGLVIINTFMSKGFRVPQSLNPTIKNLVKKEYLLWTEFKENVESINYNAEDLIKEMYITGIVSIN